MKTLTGIAFSLMLMLPCYAQAEWIETIDANGALKEYSENDASSGPCGFLCERDFTDALWLNQDLRDIRLIMCGGGASCEGDVMNWYDDANIAAGYVFAACLIECLYEG